MMYLSWMRQLKGCNAFGWSWQRSAAFYNAKHVHSRGESKIPARASGSHTHTKHTSDQHVSARVTGIQAGILFEINGKQVGCQFRPLPAGLDFASFPHPGRHSTGPLLCDSHAISSFAIPLHHTYEAGFFLYSSEAIVAVMAFAAKFAKKGLAMQLQVEEPAPAAASFNVTDSGTFCTF